MQDNIKNRFYEKYGVDPNGSKLQNIDILNNKLFELKSKNADEDEILKCRIALAWAKNNVAGQGKSTAPISNILEDKSEKCKYRSSEVVVKDALKLIESGKLEPAAVMLSNENKFGNIEAGIILNALNSNKSISGSIKNTVAFANGVEDADALSSQYKKLHYYMNSHQTDKFVYEISGYEKIAPVDANIMLCEYFIIDKEVKDKREGVAAANKLIKLKAKEGYYFLGLSKLFGLGGSKNIPEGKGNLKKFLSLAKDGDPNDSRLATYILQAKVYWADAIYTDNASTVEDLIEAQSYYEEAIQEGYRFYEQANGIKKKISEKQAQRKKKRVGTIVALSIVACVLALIGFLVYKFIVPLFPKDGDEGSGFGNSAHHSSVAEGREERKASLSDYELIVDDSAVDGIQSIDVAEVTATTELVDSTGYVYKASNMFDGNPSTSWQESEAGSGTESIINITLVGSNKIAGIGFKLGNQRSENSFVDNNRPKQLLIKIGDDFFTYDFEDTTSWQCILYDKLIEAEEIQIQIVDVYKGNKWDDTCISEIIVY